MHALGDVQDQGPRSACGVCIRKRMDEKAEDDGAGTRYRERLSPPSLQAHVRRTGIVSKRRPPLAVARMVVVGRPCNLQFDVCSLSVLRRGVWIRRTANEHLEMGIACARVAQDGPGV